MGFPVPAGSAGDALVGARALGVRGLSVTMPHKDAVAGLVDRRSPLADRLGAVNCVIYDDRGSFGDNTDGAGLVAALRRGDRFDPGGRNCLVVGAGGAARAVIAALADAGAAEVVVVNRTPERAASAAGLAGASRAGRDTGGRPPVPAGGQRHPAGHGPAGDRARRRGRWIRPCSGRARWWWTSCTTRGSPRGSKPPAGGGRW